MICPIRGVFFWLNSHFSQVDVKECLSKMHLKIYKSWTRERICKKKKLCSKITTIHDLISLKNDKLVFLGATNVLNQLVTQFFQPKTKSVLFSQKKLFY